MTAPPYESVAPAYGVPDPRSSGLRVRLAGAAKTAPRALVVALTAFLLVNFARSHELIVQLAVLRLGKVAGVPLVILALRRLPRWQLRAAMRTGPARGMLFIGFLMVLSVPLSIWRGNSIGYLKGVGLISYVMFVTTAAMLVDTAVALTVLRATMIGVTAGAARMLLPGAPVYMESGGIPRGLFGYTYDPNDTAALFLVSIPFVLYLGNRKGSRWYVWYAAAVAMIAAMVRTGSRGGLLGLLAMIVALVVLAPPRLRGKLYGAAFAMAAMFAVVVNSTPTLRARFASTFSSEQTDYNYTSTEGRVEVWKRGVYYMVTHPVTGVGIANFPTAELVIGSELKRQKGVTRQRTTTAHNSLILIGAELGVPGLLAYVYVVATAYGGLWRVRRRSVRAASAGMPEAADFGALASAAMTSLTGLFVGGFFLSLAYSPMTLFTFALCAAVIAAAPLALAASHGTAGAVAPVPAAARPIGRRGGLWRQGAEAPGYGR